MLTNTAPADPQDPAATITATTVAIEAGERSLQAALNDIARLAANGTLSPAEVADLEADTTTRFTSLLRELEQRGPEIVDPRLWAEYEARASRRRDDRRRGPGLRGVSARTRALRERQMCVVATARVTRDVLGGLGRDDDEEEVAVRGELAAAGLL